VGACRPFEAGRRRIPPAKLAPGATCALPRGNLAPYLPLGGGVALGARVRERGQFWQADCLQQGLVFFGGNRLERCAS
jgi:hypothetical protein